ncbi:MAG: porin family protein [Devosia sp.]|nr:porin family protein [Devosia sp.]
MTLLTGRARVLLAALTLTCAAVPATASDLHGLIDAPALDWSGFYVGATAGGGILSATTTDYQAFIMGGVGGDFSQSAEGYLLGGTVGFNVQSGAAVFGVEADLQWSSLAANRSLVAGAIENNASWDWFGTVRARGGIAIDRALGYVTAGLAVVNTQYFYGWLTPVSPEYDVAVDSIEYGLTAGAGVEYALTDSMSIKLDYLYLGLPTKPVVEEGGFGDEYDFDFVSSAHVVRAGLNVRFQ